ncbi:Plasmid conjugative transfer protein PilI [Escherichia coli]|nr:Plasmid conjugative transfer protein PilI [Escherichia coli]
MSAEKFRVVIYTNTCEKKVSYIPATEDKHRYNAISDGRQWLNYCVSELPYNTTQRAYPRKQL